MKIIIPLFIFIILLTACDKKKNSISYLRAVTSDSIVFQELSEINIHKENIIKKSVSRNFESKYFESYDTNYLGDCNYKSYGLSELSFKGKYLILFTQILDSSEVILDILIITDLAQNETVTIGCEYNNKSDDEIIGIGIYDENSEIIQNLRKVWRADKKTEKFMLEDVKFVKCYNESYGV
jgi:hypothetical protein